MPERSALAQTVQWGIETTEGTAVPANKFLSAVGVEPNLDVAMDLYRAMGSNWPGVATLLNEASGFDLTGRPDFNQILYPLAGAISDPVVTTPGGGTLSRQYAFALLKSGADTRNSFTIEWGDANFAERAAGVVFPDFNLAISPDAIEIGGRGIGKAVATGITLTATPTAIASQIVTPLQFNVYADDTFGGLGATKLTRAFSANFGISNHWGRVRTIDRALAGSHAATIQTEGDSACDLTIMRDTVGQGFLTTMRNGATKWIRLEAVGPVIELAITYSLIIDFAAKIGDAPSFGNEQDIATITLPLRLVADAGSVNSATVTVVNTLTQAVSGFS